MEGFRIALRTGSIANDASRERRGALLAIARSLEVTPRVAEEIVARAPVTLPVRLSSDEAEALAAKLRAGNVACDVESARAGPAVACVTHPRFDAEHRCDRCEEDLCVVCVATRECARCAAKVARTRFFFRARVSFLLAVLAGALVYAWHDVANRRARNDWTRTLDVAIVVARRDDVDPAAIAQFRARASALEARMTSERGRYASAAPAPFAVHVIGPVAASSSPPAPEGDGLLDAARASWALAKWTREVDARAGVDSGRFDVRLYVVARRPVSAARTLVEGRGEQGGRVGVVEVELDETMVDLTLIVCAHELMHTLGASDEYDASGRSKIPDGLAEPERGPDQRYAEIMARNRPVGPGQERVPETLDEIAVGRATAREIGW